jgi:uncharacterized membrane protein YphA (DoxX/SURF4 family)
MDAAHLHLLLNHLPISGLLFAVPILLLAAWKKDTTLRYLGLGAVLLTGAASLATFFTGEPAEEVMERLPGISEELIKAHEEAAETAIWFVVAAALLASLALALGKRSKLVSRWGLSAVTLFALISIALLARANNRGGQISHPEIRASHAVGKGE